MTTLILVTYFLSLFLFLTNIVIYPGFLSWRLGLDTFYIFILYIAVLGFGFFRKRGVPRNRYLDTFYFVNNKIILPVSFVFALVFAILEEINHQNFVLANFKVHYIDMVFIFSLSYLTFLFAKGREEIVKNYKKYIFGFSIFLIIVFWILKTGSRSLDVFLTEEDGILETIQFFLFLFSALVSFLCARHLYKKSKILGFVYLILGLGLMFIAMEEISWGQRFFGISTPEYWAEMNDQNETTIHNLSFFNSLQSLAYLLIGLYASFSWILQSMISVKGKYSKFLYLFTPQKYLFFFFFPTVLYNGLYIPFIGTYDPFSEFTEFMLAMGIGFFVFVNFTLVKKEN